MGGAQYRGSVQYRGDIMGTMGDILSTVGDIMINVGDTLGTVGVFSTMMGYHKHPGGIRYRGEIPSFEI